MPPDPSSSPQCLLRSMVYGRVARRVRYGVFHSELEVQVGFAPVLWQGRCAAGKEHRGARGYLPPRGHRPLMYFNSLQIQPDIAVSQSALLQWLLLSRWLYKLASLCFPHAHARCRSCTNGRTMLRHPQSPWHGGEALSSSSRLAKRRSGTISAPGSDRRPRAGFPLLWLKQ